MYIQIVTGKSARCLALLVLLGFVGGCAETAITMQPIQAIGEQLLQTMDDAYRNKDTSTLAGLLHEDMTYQASVSIQGRPSQELSLTRPMWLQTLNQSFAMTSNYTLERSDIQVRALDNGELVVKSTYRESSTMQNMNVANEGVETITLDVDGDRVTVKDVAAEISSTMSRAD